MLFARWTKDNNTRIITLNDNYSGNTAEQAYIVGENIHETIHQPNGRGDGSSV